MCAAVREEEVARVDERLTKDVGTEQTDASGDLAADRNVEVGVKEADASEVNFDAVADVLSRRAVGVEPGVRDREAAEVVARRSDLDVTGVVVERADPTADVHPGSFETLDARGERLDVLVEGIPSVVVCEGQASERERSSAKDELLHGDSTKVVVVRGLLRQQRENGGLGATGCRGFRQPSTYHARIRLQEAVCSSAQLEAFVPLSLQITPTVSCSRTLTLSSSA